MTDNITGLDTITTLDIPQKRILEAAKEECTGHVVVIGWDRNNELFVSSSTSECAEILWLIEVAKKKLLESEYD